VTLPDDTRGIIYHPVSLPIGVRPPPEVKTVDKLLEYLKEDSLKPTVARIRHDIRSLGKGIEEYATQGYIGYKHTSGRQFAYIKIHRKAIEFGAHVIDENKQLLDYEGMRIESDGEDYSELLEKAKAAFINLGGKIGG